MGANLAARVTLTPKETQVYTPMNALLIYLAVGTQNAQIASGFDPLTGQYRK